MSKVVIIHVSKCEERPFHGSMRFGGESASWCEKMDPIPPHGAIPVYPSVEPDSMPDNCPLLLIPNHKDVEYVIQTKKHRKCKEKNCQEMATIDYNGNGYWVCGYHNEKLSKEFDEEYR